MFKKATVLICGFRRFVKNNIATCLTGLNVERKNVINNKQRIIFNVNLIVKNHIPCFFIKLKLF